MEFKQSFKIGELAKLFNISADSIRYYEKMGLLNPLRDKGNNYRVYTMDDVRSLAMIRELLGLNFSIERIGEFVSYRTVDSTTAMLQEELNAINASLADLFERRVSIESRLNALQKGREMDELEQVRLIEMNDRHCLMMANSNNIEDYEVDYYLVKYMHSQRRKVDTIGACDCYTLDTDAYNESADTFVTKNVFFYSPTIFYQSNYVLPAGKYLSIYYRGSLSKTSKFVPCLFDYARANGLKAAGDVIELCHIDEYETSIESEYLIELQLPVE